MTKPGSIEGYGDERTLYCERVLVTLLRGLGPWKDSVYLIGGLTPRYLVKARPPAVPPHAGTMDVDLVIDLEILANTEAYASLEQNLKKLGFERAENAEGRKVSWRWQTRTAGGGVLVVDLLSDANAEQGVKAATLAAAGGVSALGIPHAGIVFDLHERSELRAELLGDDGVAVETVRHANLVGFTCLKALAFEQRHERKDAHDLLYCLEHAGGGLESTVQTFREQRAGKHGAVIAECLAILRRRFATDQEIEGYRKDGPVAVAKFEYDDSPAARDSRVRRQREVSDLIEQFLKHLEA